MKNIYIYLSLLAVIVWEPLVIMSGKMSSMNNTYLSKRLSLQEAMVLLPSTLGIRTMEK